MNTKGKGLLRSLVYSLCTSGDKKGSGIQYILLSLQVPCISFWCLCVVC